ncbi:MAG: PIG-L deacetylase family protein [Nocardioidaceae bacterium]
MDQHTPATNLPAWSRVLVVVAHPDDESFGLGAIIDKFTSSGSEVHVLTLTHGEASTLGGEIDDLGAERQQELLRASEILQIASVELRDWPDGALEHCDEAAVIADIKAAIALHQPDGLLVFESQGVNRHPDHAAATARAMTAVAGTTIPVLAWTVTKAIARQLNAEVGSIMHGDLPEDIDFTITVSREKQRRAIEAHVSQLVPGGLLFRRLELLQDKESLRWLQAPA